VFKKIRLLLLDIKKVYKKISKFGKYFLSIHSIAFKKIQEQFFKAFKGSAGNGQILKALT
jgi:hypothetical protein